MAYFIKGHVMVHLLSITGGDFIYHRSTECEEFLACVVEVHC